MGPQQKKSYGFIKVGKMVLAHGDTGSPMMKSLFCCRLVFANWREAAVVQVRRSESSLPSGGSVSCLCQARGQACQVECVLKGFAEPLLGLTLQLKKHAIGTSVFLKQSPRCHKHIGQEVSCFSC